VSVNPLLDLSGRPIIAHRGASGSAPENTIPAFKLAVESGADAFELDVRLTADGVPVLLHDRTLNRTTDGTGPLRAFTLEQLRDVDAGARFTRDRGQSYPFRGADARIPTFQEVLRAFPEMPCMVDVKEPEAQEAVRRVVLEERAAERCVLASEYYEALRVFREPPFATASAGVEIAALYRAVLFRRVPVSVPYRCLSVPVRHRGLPVPTRAFVAAARRLGCPVHVWTVNRAVTARLLWSRGVAGVVTNFPDLLGQVRNK
jgi:glycerophosphoryl diester phosphodiesterase